MNRVFLFAILVVSGIVGVLLMLNSANQNNTTNTNNLSLLPSPTTVLETSNSTSTPSAIANETDENTPEFTTATITTSQGDITMTLYSNEAPNTVRNFIQKGQSGYYNNLTFHRVEDWVLQGGDPLGNGTGGGKIATELNSKPFVTGSVGVARGQDINVSNDSQFFITKSDASWLNNQYTNFGIVTSGMDVVNKMKKGDKIINITFE